MRIFIFLILILFASSCVTQRRCNSKFPPSRDTLRIVTTRDSIVYRDTIVKVEIPGDIQIDSVPIPCPPPPPPPAYIPDTARAETDYAKAWAYFKYPNINLKLEQKASILEIKLDSAIQEAHYWKSEYEKITITPEPVKFIPKIYKQAMGICIFIFACVFIFIGWKVYKTFVK